MEVISPTIPLDMAPAFITVFVAVLWVFVLAPYVDAWLVKLLNKKENKMQLNEETLAETTPPTIEQLTLEIRNLAHHGWEDRPNAEFLFREIGKRAQKIAEMAGTPGMSTPPTQTDLEKEWLAQSEHLAWPNWLAAELIKARTSRLASQGDTTPDKEKP